MTQMPIHGVQGWLVKLDADGNPTGPRVPLGTNIMMTWADKDTEDIPSPPINPPGSGVPWKPHPTTMTSTRTYTQELADGIQQTTVSFATRWTGRHGGDGHPDPLVVSDTYYDPLPGWYVLDVMGVCSRASGIIDLYMPVVLATDDPVADARIPPCLWGRYHHISLDYLREVARQLRSGERIAFSGDHFTGTVVCTRISRYLGGDIEPVETRYAETWAYEGDAAP